MYYLLKNADTQGISSYRVDLTTGTITTGDGVLIAAIFKKRLPDLYGLSSITLYLGGSVRNKKVELMEVM